MKGIGLLIFAVLLVYPVGGGAPDPNLGIGSRYMGPVPPGATDAAPFAWTDTETHAVIVYLTGSTTEPKPDACDTSRPGQNVPHTIADLAGAEVAGIQMTVFAFCTPTKVGGWNQPGGDKIPKVLSRAWELQDLLLYAERQGIPANRLFVAGQSAGGWAGLLVQGWGQARMGGLIAFAPAFAGHDGRRRPIWQQERDRQAAQIGAASQLNALVYGFEKDRFEPPRVMRWLSGRDDIEYVRLSLEQLSAAGCTHTGTHTSVFRDCFRHSQRARLLRYIEERLKLPR